MRRAIVRAVDTLGSLSGGCACGAIQWRLETRLRPDALPLRACACSFCRSHGARTTSDPAGRIRITVRSPERLVRHRFGERTADFLVCNVCQTYVAAVVEEGEQAWATVNVETATARLPQEASSVSYEGEDAAARLSRRKKGWTPAILEGFGQALRRPRTLAVHAGDEVDPRTGSLDEVHVSSAFAFRDAASAAEAIAGRSDDFVYGRWANPTVRVLERKVAALEGTEDAVATASGMAAISSTLLRLLGQGDQVVAPRAMYGEARVFLAERLPALGMTTTFVDTTDLLALRRMLEEKRPRVLYLETPANPTLGITDLDAACAAARDVGATTVCDGTFATPALQRPRAHGVDVVVHSMTKYLGGHGDAIGGVVAADAVLCHAIRTTWLRSLGGVLSPWTAWIISRGLRTLPLRMEAHSAGALRVAQFLAEHPAVATVFYPFLPTSPGYEVAQRQMRAGGGMLAFELRGGLEAGRAVQERVRIATLAVSLGDIRSLITHPATTTHANVPYDARRAAGISDGLVRYSVGLEDPEDLVEDLDQALRA